MTVILNAREIDDWIAEAQIQEFVRQSTEKALAAVDARLGLRVPKTEKERRNGFVAWLAVYRAKIILGFQTEFSREFLRATQSGPKSDAFRHVALQSLWFQLEQDAWSHFLPKLLSYAILSQAIAWGRKNVGDASLYGQPQRDGDLWRVALGVAGYGENLGQITLDMDGNIIPEQTTTRQELLKKIHDYSAVLAETVNA